MAVIGGWSPHRASISESVLTTRPVCSASVATTVRRP
jgi:hypothetical protein